MTLEEALEEFKKAKPQGFHVGTLEAMLMLKELSREENRVKDAPRLSPDEEQLGLFLDWLLHVKDEKRLAYELLQRVGRSIVVGDRTYWLSDQGEQKAIAWESRYTYPDADSEIWDIIRVE